MRNVHVPSVPSREETNQQINLKVSERPGRTSAVTTYFPAVSGDGGCLQGWRGGRNHRHSAGTISLFIFYLDINLRLENFTFKKKKSDLKWGNIFFSPCENEYGCLAPTFHSSSPSPSLLRGSSLSASRLQRAHKRPREAKTPTSAPHKVTPLIFLGGTCFCTDLKQTKKKDPNANFNF